MKIQKFSISEQINKNFKSYAIYTLKHRGIPEFIDSLTNIQRLILLVTKPEFKKTVSIIGGVIDLGYHHGPASLEKSINRLAKTYNCSEQLLEGDGFFGTYVNPVPSAARYTSVKINPVISNIIKEYSYLNTIDEEGNYKALNTTIPLGLLITTVGIAVGYRTLILPRKLSDLKNFIDGKANKCEPSFLDYPKRLYRKLNKDDNLTWVFESQLDIDEKNLSIKITNMPPMLNYDSFIKKLDKVIDSNQSYYKTNPSIDVINNSKDKADIIIKIKNQKHSQDFSILCDKIRKITSIIVQEKIVFIKDDKVLQYSCIEDYLKDFKIKNETIFLNSINWHIEKDNNELNFQNAKLEFLKFLYGYKRTDTEILNFINNYDDIISKKLDLIKARSISKEEMDKTVNTIKSIEKTISENSIKYNKQLKLIESLPKELNNIYDNSLFDSEEIDEIDGIEVFKFEEIDNDGNDDGYNNRNNFEKIN